MKRVLVAFDANAAQVVARHNPAHPALAQLDAVGASAADAHDVLGALGALGYEASLLPLGLDACADLGRVARERPDIVFNLCDTLRGAGDLAPALPAFLELAGVPVAGASSLGMALSKRKQDVKAALARAGVPTPRYQAVDRPAALAELRLDIEPPVIVKPAAQHASIGIGQASLAWDAEGAAARARWLFERGMGPSIVEEYVDGEEWYVLVAGEPPRAFGTVRCDFDFLPEGYPRVRTFDVKWFRDPAIAGERSALADPRWSGPIPVRAPAGAIAPEMGSRAGIGAAAVEAFLAGGCRDWARVDFRIDAGGIPMVIDVTPNAYLSASSSAAESAAASGVAYEALIRLIVEGAIARMP